MSSIWTCLTFSGLIIAYGTITIHALPVAKEDVHYEVTKNVTTDTNGTAKDLYVIKTIVYEVGILTDATNNTDNNTETHEQVDLTFFDPITNGSAFDLTNIPVPIETNISGVSITGIAPFDLGTIELPSDNEESATLNTNFPLQVPILPNALISVKRNISTSDELKEVELLEKFPEFFDFSDTVTGTPLQIQTNVIPLEHTNQNEEKDTGSTQ
ncbi:zinc finger protein [Holotrichia oblita]|uniref:Zinc finger protein n=1 Tax=Holotrichia oblita TaxID=644536 RepID=A0ACB9TVH1_HOLOL|nr:zinc finger protein [Holotrichia oblita]